MSLIILYGDELVADRRCVLRYPHAYGQSYLHKKLRVAASKTFAFASVGPTLTDKEMAVLEAIIEESFRLAKGDQDMVPIAHSVWFNNRLGLSILVITKRANYFSFLHDSESARVTAYADGVNELKEHTFVRFESDMPAASGTGAQVAVMALREGITMNKLMPIVADVIYTVSPEFDLVHRDSLKRMKL